MCVAPPFNALDEVRSHSCSAPKLKDTHNPCLGSAIPDRQREQGIARKAMHRRDEDEDLPWDPLWAYVLGEDEFERHWHRPQFHESFDVGRHDESRDAGDSGGNRLAVWLRRQRETVATENREEEGEKWQWELDTSTFFLDSSRKRSMFDVRNREDREGNAWRSWNKKRDASSWIGTIWKDRSTAAPRRLSALRNHCDPRLLQFCKK